LSGDLLQGNLYATYFPTDTLYFDGIAMIGGGDNNSRRHIVIPRVTDDAGGRPHREREFWQPRRRIDAERRLQLDGWRICCDPDRQFPLPAH
jgi:hypothetical protein